MNNNYLTMNKLSFIFRRSVNSTPYSILSRPYFTRSLLATQRFYSKLNYEIEDHNNELFRKVQLS